MDAEFIRWVGNVAIGVQRLRSHPDPAAPRFLYCLGDRGPDGRPHWLSTHVFETERQAVAAAEAMALLVRRRCPDPV